MLLIVVLLLGACGGEPAPSAALRPSPTIAVMVPSPPGLAPAPAPIPAAPAPTSAPTTPEPTRPPAALFQYLWPTQLPEGMAIIPAESRVAQTGEIGGGDTGFYLLTFGDSGRRLVLGGGAVEPFGISGPSRVVQAGTYAGTLTEQGEQRQLILGDVQGNLFIYGLGISADELIQAAASLQPIEADALRRRVEP